ncbi:MAG: class I SAM-dependent methyltransferase [Alphaproteobacteria bacterium]|nr:class I SAM-dependent methyltransferase [Alphaproteobacteria bacterium]
MNNADQVEYWNGPAGQKWVDQSDRLDAMLAPFADTVIAAAALKPGEAVMDIGCGAGALTLRAAAVVGAGQGALGVDVSAPLIALARARAAEADLPARFELADASAFTAPDPADIVISRFGVMFFDDPAAAFANIRHAVKPGGRLAFACWQALSLNDWALAPLQAAMPFLKEAPAPADPTAPGPFAFQDKDRVAGILSDAGWANVVIEPVEQAIILPGDDTESTAKFMMQLGPLSRLLAAQGIDEAQVEAALIALMQAHKSPEGRIAMKSACWQVSAGNA